VVTKIAFIPKNIRDNNNPVTYWWNRNYSNPSK
jgi:hypothetical protein